MPPQDSALTDSSQWIEFASTRLGAVLLHDADPQSRHPLARLYRNPLRYITAHRHEDLQNALEQVDEALESGLHLAGYITYEAGLSLHGLSAHPLPHGEPLLCFGVYREPERSAPGLLRPAAPAEPQRLALFPTLSRPHYERCVTQIQAWIAAGDIYQANYTMPLQSQTVETPPNLYTALLQQQPAAHAAILNLAPEGLSSPLILSFSPELFFATDTRRGILTRPMKGTAPRSTDAEADRRSAAWLAADEKNRAEHLMIVDLLRNDLGRICETGSIIAENLFHVQTLSTVHQMVSDIRGRLRADTRWAQIIPALFPSGSITGAPKRRAMQLLHQVENAPRGVYTGMIGVIAPTGESSFSVAIRTLTLRPANGTTEVTCGVGGGIVADSTPAAEYSEAFLKASFTRRASQPVRIIETVRSENGTIRWMQSHLDRVERSALALNYPFDRNTAQGELLRHAAGLPPGAPYRTRMLVERNGAISIYSQPLDAWPYHLNACLAAQRSHLGDPALAHKTTFRGDYDRALHDARIAGFDDALFCNDAGLVTEGCLTNLFYVHGEQIATPALTCGVLPGILRQHLLQQGLVSESVLPIEALIECDLLFLGNSLRGIYPVRTLQLSPGKVRTWTLDMSRSVLETLNVVFAQES